MTQLHENLRRQDTYNEVPATERSFGIVFTAVLAVIAIWPVIDGMAPRWWAVLVSGCLLLVTFIRPKWLELPNRLWHRFGLLLASIIGPVAILIVYALAIVPMGMIMRALGKDPLRLKLDANAKTYWIPRQPPGPDPKGFRDQF